jgi:aryl carrier-like protein
MRKPIDWSRFLKTVKRHRIIGLANEAMSQVEKEVPCDIGRELGELANALVQRNLALAGETVRLSNLFAANDLPVVFFKGVSLGMLAYGDIGLRHSKDIDVFVSPDSVLAAAALLRRAGYDSYNPPATFSDHQLRMWLLRSKELKFNNYEAGFQVELHVRLFDNPMLMPAGLDSLRLVPITATIGLRTFGEEDTFAYLCAHGAIHRWFRLKWLADIGALLAHQPNGGVERLYLASEKRGVGRCAAQAILLCQRFLGATIPEQLAAGLARNAPVRRLEAVASEALTNEIEPTQQQFKTLRANLSHFLLNSSWRYWLAELRIQLINPLDILTLPLSDRLQLLYPALRVPLWLYRRTLHRRPDELNAP